MRILALDPATVTGWAFCGGDKIGSGVADFSPKRGDSEGVRLLKFRSWLTLMVKSCNAELIAFEQVVRVASAAVADVLYGFRTEIITVADALGVERLAVNPQEVKTEIGATGKANRKSKNSKPLSLLYASKMTGREIKDHNEADALVVLNLALKVLFLGPFSSIE